MSQQHELGLELRTSKTPGRAQLAAALTEKVAHPPHPRLTGGATGRRRPAHAPRSPPPRPPVLGVARAASTGRAARKASRMSSHSGRRFQQTPTPPDLATPQGQPTPLGRPGIELVPGRWRAAARWPAPRPTSARWQTGTARNSHPPRPSRQASASGPATTPTEPASVQRAMFCSWRAGSRSISVACESCDKAPEAGDRRMKTQQPRKALAPTP